MSNSFGKGVCRLITSRRNPKVRRMRAVARGAKAAPSELCFVEGVRLVEEWLRSGLDADTVLIDESFGGRRREAELLDGIRAGGARVEVAAAGVLDAVSNVRSHQGIAAAVRKPAWSLDDVFSGNVGPIAALAGLQDPSNTGAIVRTAHASGACGVMSTGGVSPFNAKAVRTSMGSVFHLPVVSCSTFGEFASRARDGGVRMLACVARQRGCLSGCESYARVDLSGRVALVLGSEGSGLPEGVAAECDGRVTIPMVPGVESLNVAASAAVLLFEAARRGDG